MAQQNDCPPLVLRTPGRAQLGQRTTGNESSITRIAGFCQSPVFDLIRQARCRIDREERAAARAAEAFDRHKMLAARRRAILRELSKLSREGQP